MGKSCTIHRTNDNFSHILLGTIMIQHNIFTHFQRWLLRSTRKGPSTKHCLLTDKNAKMVASSDLLLLWHTLICDKSNYSLHASNQASTVHLLLLHHFSHLRSKCMLSWIKKSIAHICFSGLFVISVQQPRAPLVFIRTTLRYVLQQILSILILPNSADVLDSLLLILH